MGTTLKGRHYGGTLSLLQAKEEGSKWQTFQMLSADCSQLATASGDLLKIETADQAFTLVPDQVDIKAVRTGTVGNPYVFNMIKISSNS